MNVFRRLGVIATATVTAIAAMGLAAQAAPVGQILGSSNPNAIPDSYIVVLKEHAIASAAVLAAKYEVQVAHTYQHALQGFAGTMSRETAQKLAGEPGVAYVEQNGKVQLLDTQPNPPSWGLDRIDQRNLPLDNSYTYPNTAANVRAYIIDTGIRTTHTTFGGRAVWGTNTTGDGIDSDCNGHGTHVAGTVGGSQFGVAKAVQLTAVKVLNCGGSGSFAGVAAGVDWVTGNHPAGAPAVANMSLGGPGSNATVENAVRASIADGVVYAIASGNSFGADACNFTPARVLEAITVNASTRTDARANFSNVGPCTDIYAPGDGILSSYNTSDTATATLSGTSMATPHVAGGAALILSASPGMTPAQVAATIFANASTRTDARANFSNVGPCTDIYAPGDGILSSYNTSDTATATLSGTSMATPHVAGGAALILSASPGMTPAQVAATIFANATPNVITDPGAGSPNRLLFVNTGGPQPPVTTPLLRFYNGFDHLSLTASPGGNYRLEGPLGRVVTTQVAGTAPILLCRIGADYFTSRTGNCEGQIVIGVIGYVYVSQVANTHPFYRCLVRGNGEHFDSTTANCEGQITEGILGYLVN